MRFRDRRDAGRQLAELLEGMLGHGGRDDRPIVLALPRGGVPVAAEVAHVLDVPFDVFVARKVGAPGHPEFGIGAVAEGSDRLVLGEQAYRFDLSDEALASMANTERDEIARRCRAYRRDRLLPDVEGRDVVVVDDGLATGVTAEAALRALAEQNPRRLILAVPVCAADSLTRLRTVAEMACLHQPTQFRAVGLWYEDFGQVTDDEVIEMLERADTSAAH